MEFFTVYTAEAGWDVVGDMPAFGVSLPLKFLKNPAETRMFKDYSDAEMFEKGNFTYNMHRHAVSLENFESDAGLSTFWDVTSTSSFNGSTWASTIESKNYPIYATMFHPEKTSELWIDSAKHPHGINHSWESIQLNSHFSKMLVGMSRANKNSVGTYADYMKSGLDISNYKLMQTTNVGEIYVF